MSSTDPAKRIPKAIGTDQKLLGSLTLSDLAVGLLPGVVVVLGLQLLVPPTLQVAGVRVQVLTIPLAGIATGIGLIFVYLTPTYTTSLDWLGSFVTFYRRDRRLDTDRAAEQTQVKRAHPDLGAIERVDGALLGMVRVEPPSMALATDAEWRRMAEAFRDFCNTTVEFPVQFYATTQPFPIDAYLAHFRDRLDDPDVRNNPRLAALIRDYLEWYAADLDERRMTIRDHFVIVTVRPHETTFEPQSQLERLGGLPIMGLVIRWVFAADPRDRRIAMADLLDHRLRQLERGIRDLDGCEAHRIDVAAAMRVIAEFWAGDALEQGETAQLLRTRPIVGGSP